MKKQQPLWVVGAIVLTTWVSAAFAAGDHREYRYQSNYKSHFCGDQYGWGYGRYFWRQSKHSRYCDSPEIISQPVTQARTGSHYFYQVELAGSSNHHYFSLLRAPEGASIAAYDGAISWTPDHEQVGEQLFKVKVKNRYGFKAVQQFVVNVEAANSCAPTNSNHLDFADFRSLEQWQLNGDAAYLNPTNPGVLRLTNARSQASSALLAQSQLLSENGQNGSFSAAFSFRIGHNRGYERDGAGADGLVFTLQPRNDVVGVSGGGLGYQGLENSFGIEFDTWNNGSQDHHNGNHLAVNVDGKVFSRKHRSIWPRFNNGQIWYAWVDYDGDAQKLEVRLSLNGQRPRRAIMTQGGIDLTRLLAQDDMYVGFTAATGAASSVQDILSFEFNNSLSPIDQCDGPVITTTPGTNVEQGDIYLYDVDAESPLGNIAAFSLPTAPEGADINAQTGELRWDTAGVAEGDYDFVVEVSDETGAAVQQAFTVTVNLPANTLPVANDSSITTDEDSAIRFNLDATDADGDTLLVSVLSEPTNGTIARNGFEVIYTPNANYNGADQFTWQVNDGRDDSDIAVVTIQVQAVNDAPVVNVIPVSTLEDAPVVFTVNASDVDGDPLSVAATANNGAVNVTEQDITYIPTANFNGTDTVSVSVTDGSAVTLADYTVTVVAVNDAPVINVTPVSTEEDTPVTFIVDASDADGDALTTSATASNGTVAVAANEITFTPAANFNGSATITVSVSDGTEVVTADYIVTVSAVNDAPVINVAPVSTNEDTAVTFTIDASDADGDTLTTSAITSGGTATVAGNEVTFTPAANFNGEAIIQVTVTDGTETVTADYAVTVNAINDAPVINVTPVTTEEDAVVTFVVDASDADGDALTTSATAGNGTVAVAGNEITFTPVANFNGDATVQVVVTDGTETVSANYTVTIAAVNDAPVANAQSVTVDAGQSVSITLSGSDVDGDALSYSVTTQPQHGALSGTAPDVIYTANANYSGEDSFSFIANDGEVDSSPALVGITVERSNLAAPVINTTALPTAFEAAIYRQTIDASDEDGDSLSYQLITGPEGMTLDAVTGELYWLVPLTGQDAITPVELSVSDGLNTASAQFDLSVTALPSEASVEGNEFWVAFVTRNDERELFISAKRPAEVTIEYLADNSTQTVSLGANESRTVVLDRNNVDMSGFVQRRRAVRITADNPISVSALDYKVAQTDAYTALPRDMWGQEYRVMSHQYNGSLFGVIAAEDQTRLSITLADNATTGLRGEFQRVGDTYEVILNRGEVYRLNNGLDFTGTHIRSDKPVSVIGGHNCGQVPDERFNFCDAMLAQLLPVDLWGNHYLVAPLVTRRGEETYRILANENDTELRINGELSRVLDAGEYYEASIDGTASITANKPILAVHLSNSDSIDTALRRAESSLDNIRIEFDVQALVDAGVNEPQTITTQAVAGGNSVVIAALENAQVLIDGVAVDESQFAPTTPTTASSPRAKVAQVALSEGEHTITADAPVLVLPGQEPLAIYADPFMMQLADVAHWSDHYLFTVPERRYARNFINIIVKAGEQDLLLDGVPVPVAYREAHQAEGYDLYRLAVNPGDHIISAANPFALGVYGYNQQDSYGYIGGLGLNTGAVVNQLTANASTLTPAAGGEVCIDMIVEPRQAAVPVVLRSESGFVRHQLSNAQGQAQYCYQRAETGSETINVRAADQTATITLDWQAGAGDPVFTSLPRDYAVAGQTYNSTAQAVSPADDALTYQLASNAPDGLSINETNGTLTWPAPVEGRYNLEIIATAENGAQASYPLALSVLPEVVVTEAPATEINYLQNYSASFKVAQNTDELLYFRLSQYPDGMLVPNAQAASGSISWQVPDVEMEYPIALSVFDRRGRQVLDYRYTLSAFNPNNAPVFTPETLANTTITGNVGTQITVDLDATDPDGNPISYFQQSPFIPGVSLDAVTGVLTWTPTQAGTFTAGVRAQDTTGERTSLELTFIIADAVPNTAPVITSTPIQYGRVGETYIYDVNATDAEGDLLTYSLTQAAAGMTIDSNNGVINWTPATAEQVRVEVQVSDPSGASAVAFYDLQIVAADAVVSGVIEVTPTIVDVNETVSFRVQVSDNNGPVTVTAAVDGNPVTLDNTNLGTYSTDVIGQHTITATISDVLDSITVNNTFTVRDPADATDTAFPDIDIHSPDTNARVGGVADVRISVADETLVDWQLSIQKPGDDATRRSLSAGTTEISDAVVHTLDTTLMANGQYQLILQAIDRNGRQSSISRNLSVDSQLKVGQMSFTIEDLNIPLTGIPITVSRTYNSLRKDQLEDFGYGWSADYQTVRLEESQEPTEQWRLTSETQVFTLDNNSVVLTGSCIRSLSDKLVTITLPNGDVERFRPRGELVGGGAQSSTDPNCFLVADRDVNLVFDALADTDSRLATTDGQDLYLTNTTAGDLAASITDFGAKPITRYQLTTRTDYVYDLDENFGVRTITDPNGNTITYSDSGITHSSGKAISFERDSQNRITAIVDPKGSRITYSYDNNGDLESVTDRVDATTRYTYNDTHHLVDIMDPLNRRLLRNIYDDDGRLVAQEDNEGFRTEFNHNLDGRLSVITDRLGRATQHRYDDRGNVLSTVNALGETMSYTYDGNDNQLSETNDLGEVETATYNETDDQLTQTDGEGNVVSFEYNRLGQETTITDARGNVFNNAYDTVGNLLSITDPQGNVNSQIINAEGLVTQRSDALNNTTTMAYDDQGNVTREMAADGAISTYTYDENNNRLTETRTRTVNGQSVGETTTFEYDNLNRVIKTTDALGNITRTEFDAIGNEVAQVDARGNRTEMTYDAYGRLLTTTYPDNSTMVNIYDVEGNLLKLKDRNGNVTSYEYDALNRQVLATNAAGNRIQMVYDNAGRVVAEIDGEGRRTEHVYDKAGRRIRTTSPVGQVMQFTYDADGNLLTETDPEGNPSVHVYDSLDRRISTSYTNANGETIGTEYDVLGRITAQIDEAGIRTEFAYDEVGRLTKVTDALGQETSYTYDEAGNKLTQTDAEGRTTRWDYDALGRVIRRTLPMGQFELMVYDENSNLTQRTDFNGQVMTMTYDVNDRMVESVYSRNGQTDLTERMVYDNNGNLTQATQIDSTGTRITHYEYDALNRLTLETKPNGDSIRYTYNKVDDIATKVITSNGQNRLEQMGYDTANRLSTVTDKNGNITSYGYTTNGNLDVVNYANGTKAEFIYDPRNRLTRVVHRDASGIIQHQFDYTLHPTGRRTRIAQANGRTTDYAYDDLYRLTQETVSGTESYSAAYSYDRVGNRIQSIIDGVTTQYTYDANDRLTQQGGERFEYDANGSTTRATLDNDETLYQYNAKNQLIGATIAEGGTTNVLTFSYNIEGIRTAKTVGSVTTDYLVDNNRDYAQVITETTGSEQTEYLYGMDLISQQRNSLINTYHYDALGSTRALSDTAGVFSDSYDYEAFGQLLNETGDTDNAYLYAGEQRDSDLGLDYLRARYLDVNSARFTQMDTFNGFARQPLSLNKYNYALSDPVNGTDPSGFVTLANTSTANNIRSILIDIQIEAGLSILDAAFSDELGEEITPTQFGVGFLLGAVGPKALGIFSKKLFSETGLTGKVGRVACNSFDAETKVHTKHGLKLISEVEINDEVLTYNEETTVEEYKPVIHLISDENLDEVIGIKLENGESIYSTMGHLIFSDQDWVRADSLSVGDKLYDGILVEDIQNVSERRKVFNLTVDGNHNYFIGESKILAHNISPCEKAAKLLAVSIRSCANLQECDAYARQLRNVYIKNGVKGQHIRLETRAPMIQGLDGTKIADKAGASASIPVFHEAIRVGDTVFDNFNPGGIPYQKWYDNIVDDGFFFTPPEGRILTEGF